MKIDYVDNTIILVITIAASEIVGYEHAYFTVRLTDITGSSVLCTLPNNDLYALGVSCEQVFIVRDANSGTGALYLEKPE